jgi:acyl-CoA thioester hydrolase
MFWSSTKKKFHASYPKNAKASILFSINTEIVIGISLFGRYGSPMTTLTETWTGEAEAHECDALGHLNMRHYLYKSQQARQMFIINLGLPSAYIAGSPSSVKFMDAHIQYKAESRPGELLTIKSGILDMREAGMTLLHVVSHFSGAVSATIIENIEHVYLPTGQSFPWPRRVVKAARTHMIEMPNFAAPRSLDPWGEVQAPPQKTLENWGIAPVGRGVFQPRETDIFGRVMAPAILGRVSDCVAHFKGGWPEAHSPQHQRQNVMGVLLECRFICHKPIRAGQPFIFYSGVKSANKRTRRLVHNMIDPLTGRALATMDAVAALLDLNLRKIALPAPETLAHLKSCAVADLSA